MIENEKEMQRRKEGGRESKWRTGLYAFLTHINRASRQSEHTQ